MGVLLDRLRRLASSVWLRVFVTCALLAVVFSQIQLGAAGRRLADGHWALFAAATIVVLGALVLGGVRWQLFLEAAGIVVSRVEAVRASMIGAFANNFLPSQVGGDVARAWIAGGPGGRVRALATVVVDRATLLACLIGLGWIAYALDQGGVPQALVGALAASTAILLFAGAFGAALAFGSARVRHRLPPRVRGAASDIGKAVRGCADGSLVISTTALGVVYQSMALFAIWLLARSISMDVDFAVLVIALPPLLILTTLPISIGGRGVREGGFVVLLGTAGVSATDATVLSLLFAACYAIATIPGGLLLLVGAVRDSRVDRPGIPGATADDEQRGSVRNALVGRLRR